MNGYVGIRLHPFFYITPIYFVIRKILPSYKTDAFHCRYIHIYCTCIPHTHCAVWQTKCKLHSCVTCAHWQSWASQNYVQQCVSTCQILCFTRSKCAGPQVYRHACVKFKLSCTIVIIYLYITQPLPAKRWVILAGSHLKMGHLSSKGVLTEVLNWYSLI